MASIMQTTVPIDTSSPTSTKLGLSGDGLRKKVPIIGLLIVTALAEDSVGSLAAGVGEIFVCAAADKLAWGVGCGKVFNGADWMEDEKACVAGSS